jgi:parallel beta-helix repeat protein
VYHYTGISCGWVWGYTDNVSRDNRIEHNHIHDIGHGLLSDMGGIYTLGVQPGTVLRGNLIHDIEKRNYGGWAIYLDEGSSHILVENNICFNTSSTGFNQHYGRENIVRNNIFAFGKEGQVSLGRKEDHNSFTFQRNIVITDGQVAYVGRWAPSTIHPTPGNRPARLEASAFSSDLNVFWDVGGKPPRSANGGYDAQANWLTWSTFTMEELQVLGYDRHSVVADPRCADLRAFDFTLGDDSPAFGLGFKAIDMSEVGPRPVARREE